jgi:meso-butanediol dehydrogenase/(S,S)-butanediol dehydrogenase/diacetyl reductase
MCDVTNIRKLDGKIALITGVGGGQGREAVIRFAAEGATVVGCDIDGASAEVTRSAARAAGLDADIATDGVDLSDPEQARRWVAAAAERHGRIDVVYNNASAAKFRSIAELSVEDWRFTIRNELDLVFFVTRCAWPILVRSGGGTVINVASVAGWTGNRSVPFVAHMAAKGGVIAMTRQLAAEGGPLGIRVVSISPGTIITPGTASVLEVPQVRDALIAQTLVSRLGQPADVVALAVSRLRRSQLHHRQRFHRRWRSDRGLSAHVHSPGDVKSANEGEFGAVTVGCRGPLRLRSTVAWRLLKVLWEGVSICTVAPVNSDQASTRRSPRHVQGLQLIGGVARPGRVFGCLPPWCFVALTEFQQRANFDPFSTAGSARGHLQASPTIGVNRQNACQLTTVGIKSPDLRRYWST